MQMSTKFISRLLSDMQKEHRYQVSQYLFNLTENNPNSSTFPKLKIIRFCTIEGFQTNTEIILNTLKKEISRKAAKVVNTIEVGVFRQKGLL